MSLTFHAFQILCQVTGAVALFVFVLWGLGWLLVKTWEYLKVWHTLTLCIGVQMHGRSYRDRIFWQAIKERINGSAFTAKNVADFAYRCAPFDKDTSI